MGKKDLTVESYGAESLGKVAKEIVKIDEDVKSLAARMVMAMKHFDGIGLAAPQLGESRRVIVIDIPLEAMSNPPSAGESYLLPRSPFAIVNPRIVAVSEELCTREEGCLSVPGIYADVERPAAVIIAGTLLDGEEFEVECHGLLARCLQHECDHLDGVLFTDKVKKSTAKEIAPELKKLYKKGAKNKFKREK